VIVSMYSLSFIILLVIDFTSLVNVQSKQNYNTHPVTSLISCSRLQSMLFNVAPVVEQGDLIVVAYNYFLVVLSSSL